MSFLINKMEDNPLSKYKYQNSAILKLPLQNILNLDPLLYFHIT